MIDISGGNQMKAQHLSILILFLWMAAPSPSLHAGSGKIIPAMRHSIEANYYGGFVYKHTENMKVDPKGYTSSWQVDYFHQTYGKRFWHEKLNYPSFGIGLFQQYNPLMDTLGITTALVPSLRFAWWRSRKWEGYFLLGVGTAWVSKVFDSETNARNNVIGSHLNVLVLIRPGIRYFITSEWAIGLSGSLNHVSNGQVQQPNLGINTFGGTISLSHHFKETTKTEVSEIPQLKRNGYWIRMGMGIKETSTNFIKKKRPLYNLSGGYSRMTGHINKLMAGLQLTYDQTDYDELSYIYPDQSGFPRTKASNVSILLGDELMIGHLGIMALMGVYVYYPENKPGWMFWRIGGNLYSNPLGKKSDIRCFLGVSLKANGTNADHFELAGGFTF